VYRRQAGSFLGLKQDSLRHPSEQRAIWGAKIWARLSIEKIGLLGIIRAALPLCMQIQNR